MCRIGKSEPEEMCGRSSLRGRPALVGRVHHGLTWIAETVENIVTLAYVMLQRRSRSCRSREAIIAQSVISRRQLQW